MYTMGIFKIVNCVNGKDYVGSSKDIYKQWGNQFSKLENNKHPNKNLQESWNKYGKDNFKLEVVEIIYDEKLLSSARQKWVNKENSFNVIQSKRVTIRDYLRNHLKEWKEASMEHHKGICMISGEKGTVIHHIYPYYKIVLESIKSLGIYKGDFVDPYNGAELLMIKNKCLELHYQYGFGACLTNKIHKEYHSLFGFRGEVEEFKLFMDSKINNEKITYKLTDRENKSIIKYNLKSDISISKKEIDFLLEMESYNQKRMLFWMLIHSKLYGNEDGKFFMTYKQLSELSGVGTQTIFLNINALEASGKVEIISRNSKTNEVDGGFIKAPNRYRITIDDKYSTNDAREIEYHTLNDPTKYLEKCILLFYSLKELNHLPRRQYEKIKYVFEESKEPIFNFNI